MHRRETAHREIRPQPPTKRVHCTNCAEQTLNALHCWEWTQVPTGLHKAPLPYAFFRHGYATMNKTLGHVKQGWEEDWCVSSLGRIAFPCGEMYVPTVKAQRDFAGTPLSSGSEGIWCKTSPSSSELEWPNKEVHRYPNKHLIISLCADVYILDRMHTHVERDTKPGANRVHCGELSCRSWPLLSLPSGSSSAGCWQLSGVSGRWSPGDYKARSGVVTMKSLSLKRAAKTERLSGADICS